MIGFFNFWTKKEMGGGRDAKYFWINYILPESIIKFLDVLQLNMIANITYNIDGVTDKWTEILIT